MDPVNLIFLRLEKGSCPTESLLFLTEEQMRDIFYNKLTVDKA